ncbi:MAG: protein kinase [Steroidobacterales bacterium]
MKPRILIVEPDRELRIWLHRHLEILWPEGSYLALDRTQFEPQRNAVTVRDYDLVIYGVNSGAEPDGPDEEFDAVRGLLAQAGFPPLVLIAHGGDELRAVRAIRRGAADYLPRSLLNAKRLARSLRLALRRGRRVAAAGAAPRNPRLRARIAPQLELPQYSLLHKLGESARAIVYLAHSAALGRYVALKVSKPRAATTEDPQYFSREYAAISALRNAAVIDIYDYGFHDGYEFIAMEYFPCGDLKMRLQQPLTTAESFAYARYICEALRCVHGAGLIHRDLKPPNIMLRADGSIVLIDFGLAKRVDADTRSTAVGLLRGSPYYMSPEQAQGLELDRRSDLYSLGVILFEMLSGRRPYSGSTAVEVMHQHVHGPRPPLPPDLACFEPLLEGLMARAREQRYADAATAQAALMQFAEMAPERGYADAV